MFNNSADEHVGVQIGTNGAAIYDNVTISGIKGDAAIRYLNSAGNYCYLNFSDIRSLATYTFAIASFSAIASESSGYTNFVYKATITYDLSRYSNIAAVIPYGINTDATITSVGDGGICVGTITPNKGITVLSTKYQTVRVNVLIIYK